MDYSKMSDFEINCLVAEATGHKPFSEKDGYAGLQEPGDITAAIVRGPRCIGGFDPCKNPDQAWPIITGNYISLMYEESLGKWCAGKPYWVDGCEWQLDIDVIDENPLRAAMIVYLQMQESANVQDNPA